LSFMETNLNPFSSKREMILAEKGNTFSKEEPLGMSRHSVQERQKN
jgi:hypothetical protein